MRIKQLVLTIVLLGAYCLSGSAQTHLYERIDQGDAFLFGCQELTATGVYPNDANTVFLHLTVCAPNVVSAGEATITLGDSYLFGCTTYTPTAAGDMELRDTIVLATGCDSISYMTLHVVEPDEPCQDNDTTIQETIYLGESFLFGCNVVTPNEARDTTLVETLRNVGGCDSVVTLVLHVVEPCELVLGDTIRDTIQLGESYLFGCTVYTPSQDTIVSDSSYTAINGCDSVAILKLHVNTFEYDTIYLEPVCQNDPIAVLGYQRFDKDTLVLNYDTTTGFSPDTIHSYQVYVFKEPTEADITMQKVLDKGASLSGKQGRTVEGVTAFKNAIEAVCQEWQHSVAHAGNYAVALYKANFETGILEHWDDASAQSKHIARGEDSILIYMEITICATEIIDSLLFYTDPWDTVRFEVDSTLCYGETFQLYDDSVVIVTSDIQLIHVDTVLTAAQDYDSLTVYNLTVNMPSDTTWLLNVRGFHGDSIFIAGDTITTTKAATVTLTNISGCDSVVVYSVIIPEVVTYQITDTVCADEDYLSRNGAIHTISAATQWSDTVLCGTATDPDSIYTYDIYVYNFALPIAAPTGVALYCGDAIDFSADAAAIETAIAADELFAPNTTIEWYLVAEDGSLTAAESYVVSTEDESLKLVYKLVNNTCGTTLTSAEATFDVMVATDSLNILKSKLGDYLIIVDKNLVDTTLARAAGISLTEEGTEVQWYRLDENGNGVPFDWQSNAYAHSYNGYYIAATNSIALTGSYYVTIELMGADGCSSYVRSNIVSCATPANVTPSLTPNRVAAGEPMWLVDLNPEEDAHVRIYDPSGKLMDELHYNAASQQLIPTSGTSGMYLLHVVNGAVETTLKYMLK